MDQDKLEILRHSASHIMAQAVKRLYPKALLSIGPAIENGFYYDFDNINISSDDLKKIENEMKAIVKEKQDFECIKKSKEEAITYLKEKGEKYKLELINDIEDDEVTFYKNGEFQDLCKGPHVENTKELKNLKLLSVAGAYFKGDENNAMLQRIYGTAFLTKDELYKYLKLLDEAKKRDHRKLGRELDLFSIQELGGQGLVYWHPKGAFIRKIIEDFWKDEHLKHGYELINIPHIAKIDLWKTSGHLDFYQENMYSPIDIENQEYLLKPMNCPGHILVYKSHMRSYRDLPIRYAELGTVYRYERSGVLHGLMRVRGFTQDDAHIFCTYKDLENEIVNVLKFVIYILSVFDFKEYEVFLSTRPEKYVGSLQNWEKAENALKKALDVSKIKYEIDPGEGVFYGPKIDIKIKDSIGRLWQCSTIQVDFALPERFDVKYTGEDGTSHTAVMIHRALMGSLERFFGILVEHYAGVFPTWMAPCQVKIIPVINKFDDYAYKVAGVLEEKGVRVLVDDSREKLGYKIRTAETGKVPFMIIVGEKEETENKVNVRKHSKENLGMLEIDEFLKILENE